MKTLTLRLLLCASLGLIRASALPQEDPYMTQETTTPPPEDDPYATDGNLTTSLPQEEGEEFSFWQRFLDYFRWSCRDGWTMFNTQCLRFVPTKMTWEDAEKNCRSLGGDLASQFMQQQTDEIRKVVLNAGVEHGQIWVGGGQESYMFRGGNRDQAQCSHITFEGEAPEGLEDISCESLLPSVCGILIM